MLPYMPAIFAFEVASTFFEMYLTYRQRKEYKKTQIAPELAQIIPPDKFKKSQEYGLAKANFSIVSDTVDLAVSAIFRFSYVYPKLWMWTAPILDTLTHGRLGEKNEIARTLLFGFMSSLIGTVFSLPFSIYSTFVLEEKFGFNKTTVKTFVMDILKGNLISIVIGAPLLTALWYVIELSGDWLWLYFWLFTTSTSLILVVLYPSVIAPLFNKFTPLEEGPLKKDIDALAQSLKFPLSNLYVIDGSTRSSHSNAYFYGIFKKGIVLYDSLLDSCKGHDDRVVAVLAHELGHWKEWHTIKGLVMGISQMLVVSFLYGKTVSNVDMFTSFGYIDTPHIIGLMIFSDLYTPVDHVLSLFMNVISRKHEYQADQFAKNLGMGTALGDALVLMQIENLSNMSPDWLYSMYHNSHPTLLERLKALDVKPTMTKDALESTLHKQQSGTTTAVDGDHKEKKNQ